MTYTRASLMAPSKTSVACLTAGTSNFVRYQRTPTYGSPPERPVLTDAFFSKFCVMATFCKSLLRSKGPKIAQSCGTLTDSHLLSSNSGDTAPVTSPLVNFQFFSSKNSERCACIIADRKSPQPTINIRKVPKFMQFIVVNYFSANIEKLRLLRSVPSIISQR